MHRRGVGAGAIAKKKLAEVKLLLNICVFTWAQFVLKIVSYLTNVFFLLLLSLLLFCFSIQAKYKERGTVLAEDQIVQVSRQKTNLLRLSNYSQKK